LSDLIRLLILPHGVPDKERVLGAGDRLMHMDFEAKAKSVIVSVGLT